MGQHIPGHFGDFEENTRIIPLKYFFFESEARLYGARLREAGIPCFISNANIMTALPLGGGGGIGLHIREADLIVARLDYQKKNGSSEDSFPPALFPFSQLLRYGAAGARQDGVRRMHTQHQP